MELVLIPEELADRHLPNSSLSADVKAVLAFPSNCFTVASFPPGGTTPCETEEEEEELGDLPPG